MRYWLFKSEPDVWSWDMQVAKGAAGEEWNGVRNYQARNNMRAMELGDLGFFYHSNIGKEVVGIVSMLIALAVVAAVPIWLQRFDPTDAIVTFGNFRWLLVGAMFAFLAGALYRFAPPQRPRGWSNILPGMITATIIWTVASIGFSVYVSSFGRYNETYGTLGAAIVMLLWFWFTSLAILLGAELNEALMLHRTKEVANPGSSDD